MTLHISEREVRELLTMPMAIEAVEVISRRQANGEATLHPRKRIELHGGGFFHYMAAADFTAGYLAMKLYTFVRGQLCFVVPLYEIATGKMVALIEADVLGQLRTGAASGIAVHARIENSEQQQSPGANGHQEIRKFAKQHSF